MAKLKNVKYLKENGKLVAIEYYDDGSRRMVRIENGMVDYINNSSDNEFKEGEE